MKLSHAASRLRTAIAELTRAIGVGSGALLGCPRPTKRFPAVINSVEINGGLITVSLTMVKRDFAVIKQHERCMAMLDISRSVMLETAINNAEQPNEKS
jgi:hypothetical protein